MERAVLHTGGCQCGAVRYALHAEPTRAHICHCRMCQKQFGAYFAPLANIDKADISWTRGRPAAFRSSEAAERGFCRDCGTPLTYDWLEAKHLNIALGTLDAPERVPPRHQFGVESKLPWFGTLDTLPGETTETDLTADQMQQMTSRQHPDHDTHRWPPE